MPTYRSAFAYTRTQLMDKLEEQLKAALHHHYLLSLQRIYGFTHYLLDHWTDEYQGHLYKIEDIVTHEAKVGRTGKLRALATVRQRMHQQDARIRKSSHRHFVEVFDKQIGTNGKKADAWLTAAKTDAVQQAFWIKVQAMVEAIT